MLMMTSFYNEELRRKSALPDHAVIKNERLVESVKLREA